MGVGGSDTKLTCIAAALSMLKVKRPNTPKNKAQASSQSVGGAAWKANVHENSWVCVQQLSNRDFIWKEARLPSVTEPLGTFDTAEYSITVLF